MPYFSVVVPAYNACLTLRETLDAVVAQEFQDWECVVVDDGSTDLTGTIAASYADADPRVRLVSQQNKGTGGAYNAGVSAATGDYIVLCSADDVLLPAHLSSMVLFTGEHGACDIFSCNGYYWYPDGSRELVYSSGEIPPAMSLADLIMNCFYSVGAAYRRRVFDLVGGYREDAFGEDYDFWLRAMALGARHAYLSEPLTLHRISAEQKSANIVASFESDIRLLENLSREFDLSSIELRALKKAIRIRADRITRIESGSDTSAVRNLGAKIRAGIRGRARLRRLIVLMRRALGRS